VRLVRLLHMFHCAHQFVAVFGVNPRQPIIDANFLVGRIPEHFHQAIGTVNFIGINTPVIYDAVDSLAGKAEAFFALLEGQFAALAFDRITDRPFEQGGVNIALGEVISRAGLHRFQINLNPAPAGEQNHRLVIPRLDRFADKLDPIARTEIVIHKDRIVLIALNSEHTGLVVFGPFQEEFCLPGLLQHLTRKYIVILIIINQEDVVVKNIIFLFCHAATR